VTANDAVRNAAGCNEHRQFVALKQTKLLGGKLCLSHQELIFRQNTSFCLPSIVCTLLGRVAKCACVWELPYCSILMDSWARITVMQRKLLQSMGSYQWITISPPHQCRQVLPSPSWQEAAAVHASDPQSSCRAGRAVCPALQACRRAVGKRHLLCEVTFVSFVTKNKR